jgi:hypothetical protein
MRKSGRPVTVGPDNRPPRECAAVPLRSMHCGGDSLNIGRPCGTTLAIFADCSGGCAQAALGPSGWFG